MYICIYMYIYIFAHIRHYYYWHDVADKRMIDSRDSSSLDRGASCRTFPLHFARAFRFL